MAPHPPPPGGFVGPAYPSVEEAVARVPFPISKRELMAEIDDATVVVDGRNVDLRALVKDLHDDFFETEDEFRESLERALGPQADATRDEPPVEATTPAGRAERPSPGEPSP